VDGLVEGLALEECFYCLGLCGEWCVGELDAFGGAAGALLGGGWNGLGDRF